MRVLLIAEACNPEWTSVPLVGWNWYRHLRELVDVTLVTQIRNRDAVLRAGVDPNSVVFIDSERWAKPCYRVAKTLTLGRGLGWTTQQAAMWLPYLYFERLVARRFLDDIRRGAFHVVHRLTPLSPVQASPLTTQVAPTPFVVGPLNGGLPWPKGTTGTRFAELEFLSYLRNAYRWLPYVGRTYRRATVVIAGSRHTQRELERCFGRDCAYLPENGIDLDRFHASGRRPPSQLDPFRIVYVGRLVPLKRVDTLLRAFQSSELLRARGELVIIGEGPERPSLESIIRDGPRANIKLLGWVPNGELPDWYRSAALFVLPSIKEFGGAVVAEALACGAPAIVSEHGGPAEIIDDACGVTLQVEGEPAASQRLRGVLETLLRDPNRLDHMSVHAAQRAAEEFAWTAKAKRLVAHYEFAVSNGAPATLAASAV